MKDHANRQLGNYRLTRLLGQGGFAGVYLGEHIYLKTQAAIKVLHAQLTRDMMGNFVGEAQIIAQLTHPHIVRVLDFGVENLTPFLVMEYAPHGTLRQRHPRTTSLPLSLIVSYVKQVAGALQYAHDRRLVHRDVKPENMLLGRENEVLLSDFGIATIAPNSRSLQTQDFSGTILYMAPEQIQGKSRPASDQYSLAIITYEWMTGHCPYQGSFAEVASQHMFAPFPSFQMKNPAIPSDVAQVLKMALSKNPEERFSRVEAFAIALEQASQPGLSTLPMATPSYPNSPSPVSTVISTPPTKPSPSIAPVNTDSPYLPNPAFYQSSSGAAPHFSSHTPPRSIPETVVSVPLIVQPQRGISRRAVIAGVLGIAVVAGGSAALFAIEQVKNSPVRSATSLAATVPPHSSTPVSKNTPVPKKALIHRGASKEYTVSWSPDGTKIASAGDGEIIEAWDATSGNALFNLLSGASTVYSVVWSPDGTKIASGQYDGTVKIWDATNGNFISSLKGHSSRVNSVSWSSDSKNIVSGSGDKTARVWDVASGNAVTTYRGHSSYINSVAWSHNSPYIVSGSGDKTAQVWNAFDGTLQSIYSNHTNEVLAVAWSRDNSTIASASDDDTVQVWDTMNGNRYVNYTGHTGFVVAMAWSPDGQYIASGGVDTTVQIWKAIDGTLVFTYTGHTAEVEGITWSPDSKRVASASDDKTVQLWQVP
jgi:WD40 repeat protein/tRNA A-37 threonylcarbamoyl transferase component Bud32